MSIFKNVHLIYEIKQAIFAFWGLGAFPSILTWNVKCFAASIIYWYYSLNKILSTKFSIIKYKYSIPQISRTLSSDTIEVVYMDILLIYILKYYAKFFIII